MTDTVLVIGGTGQLGAPVVGQLRGDGYRVRALARRLPPAHDRDADLEYVEGDWTTLTRCAARLLAVPRCT